MATDDEVRRLILEVVGEDRVRSLREQIDKEKESLVQVTSALSHMTAEQISADKGVQAATQKLASLNQELRKTRTANGDLAMAALDASRALEDLQYGFAGVVNNIPGVTAAIGKAAGLTTASIAGITAAISLLAVGINQLIKHKDDIIAFFTDKPIIEFAGALESVKKTVEELSKKEIKTVFDVQAIEGARATAEWMERAQKAGEAFRGLKSEAEEAAGKLAREAIAETPGGASALQARMVEIETQRNISRSARLQMLQEEVRFQEAKIPGLAGGREGWDFKQIVKPMIDAAKEEIIGVQEEARRQAQRTVGAAFLGVTSGEAKGRERFAAMAREAGAVPLADVLSRTTPEAMEERAIRKDAEVVEKQQREWAERLEKEKRAAADLETKVSEDARRIEEREAEKTRHEQERSRKKAEQEAERAEKNVQSEMKRREEHEASLLGQSFGERNAALAQQALAQGMTQDQIRGMMVQAFQQFGASRGGAELAASQQMEQALVGVNRNGGLAATLVNQQSKIMHQFQREQAEQRRMLEEAWRRTSQVQDNAFRRGQ